MTDESLVIRAAGLRREFDDRVAVRDLSFSLRPGSVCGLIGPNGSGKSTTIRMLLGLLEPTAGHSTVLGEDSLELGKQTRQRIGYLAEEPFFDYGLPLFDLAQYVAGFYEHWDWDRTRRLCDELDLDKEQPLREMSAGQRRRAELLLTLAPDPDLLILDDPTVGLDATVRRSFLWGVLETARDEGKAVLLSSHVLTDLERVVDHVVMLRSGELVADQSLDELQDRVRRLVFVACADEPGPIPGECSRRRVGRDLVIETTAYDASLAARFGSRADVRVETLGFEDVFCALAGAPEAALGGVRGKAADESSGEAEAAVEALP